MYALIYRYVEQKPSGS